MSRKKSVKSESDRSVSGSSVKEAGRIVAGSYYDFQEVRLGAMSRIRDVIRKRNEGIAFDEVEEKLDKDKRTFDKKYQDANLLKIVERMYSDGKLEKKEYDYIMKVLELAEKSIAMEGMYRNLMMAYINEEDMWNRFLSKVRGLGAVLSANLIKNFGYCERYDKVSSLWRHCGYHVISGKAPRRVRGEDIDFSPKLRTLCWKVADSFIKQNSPVYRQIYDGEKRKQLANRYPKGELFQRYSKPYVEEDIQLKLIHAHNRALRKMVKIFLQHYWIVGRTLAGLSTREPYVFNDPKHTHYISWQEVIQANEDLQDTKHRKGKRTKVKAG